MTATTRSMTITNAIESQKQIQSSKENINHQINNLVNWKQETKESIDYTDKEGYKSTLNVLSIYQPRIEIWRNIPIIITIIHILGIASELSNKVHLLQNFGNAFDFHSKKSKFLQNAVQNAALFMFSTRSLCAIHSMFCQADPKEDEEDKQLEMTTKTASDLHIAYMHLENAFKQLSASNSNFDIRYHDITG